MGVINNIKNYFEERSLNKLEKKVSKIWERNNISFNPYNISNVINPLSDNNFSLRTMENFTWFSGSVEMLLSFYYYNKRKTGQFSKDDLMCFWGNVPFENRRVHTRLPALCSNKFVDLLIGSGVNITVESFNEDEIDEIKTNQTQEILNEIYKDNNLFELLTKSIANESWGGDIAWKIVIDTNFSKLPIVQSYDIRNYEVITKYGREQAIIFKEWHEHEKSKYELHEIYSRNENGDAEIEYILYKVVVDKKEIVSLNSIPQTKKIIEMLDSDGEENKITFVGLKTPLAWHKANRLPNTEFNGSPYGESDYAGCYSLFDSADEIVSTNIDDVRKNRTLRFIPDSLIPRDDKGQIVKFNDFKLNYIQVNGNDAAGSDNENEIRTSTPPSNTLEHIENWKNMLTTILINIGLSPTTI